MATRPSPRLPERLATLAQGSLEDTIRDGSADAAARLVSDVLGDLGIIALLGEHEDKFDLFGAYHADRFVGRAMKRRLQHAERRVDHYPRVAGVLASGEPLLITALPDDGLGPFRALREYIAARHPHSAVFVPLIARGQRVGVLVATREAEHPPFTDDDLPLALHLAEGLAVHLDNARRYDILKQRTEIQSAVLDVQSGLGEGLAIVDRAEERFVYVNDALAEIYGYTPAALISMRSYYDLLAPGESERLTAQIDRVPEGDVMRFETSVIRADGTQIEVEFALKAAPEFGPNFTVALVRDITSRYRREVELRATHERFRSVVVSLEEGVIVWDRDGSVSYANPAAARIIGVDESQLYADPDWWRRLNPRFEDGSPLPDAFSPRPIIGKTTEPVRDIVLVITRPDGRVVTGALSRQPLRNSETGEVIGMVTTFEDITERRKAEARLRHQALHHPLTDLPNRAYLLELAAEIVGPQRAEGTTALVLVLDVDNFKVLHNSLGHEVGDNVLRQLVPRLQGVLRPDETLAHLGSDEFAILSTEISAQADARALARRVLQVFDEPFSIPGGGHVISACAGIAIDEPHRATAAELLRDANAAMHRAKALGPGCQALFDDTMRHAAMRRMRIERSLRRTLAARGFHLAYQPIVSLDGSVTTGIETLLRWHHDDAPAEGPSAFVPVAEESGLIIPLGAWVIQEACRQARSWADAHPGTDWPMIGVNVSALQLADPSFPETVANALSASGLKPGRLALEITETALVESGGSVRTFEQLKTIGVRLVVDDFGTGYSSLSYLTEFPLDTLKIDRSFIAGLTSATPTFPIVEAVAGMAQALGLRTIAEGVESEEQLRILEDLDCDSVQGFLFGRPMPPAELEAWVLDLWERGDRHLAAGQEQLVTLSEAADALGVSRSTVRRWADAGRLRSVRTPGGHRRVAMYDLRRMMGSQRPPSTAVNRVAAPSGPIQALAELIAAQGDALAAAAAKAVYAGEGGGWFKSGRAEQPLHEWLTQLAHSSSNGGYGKMLDAYDALMRRARLSGATLLERQLFMEAFSEATHRALGGRGASSDVVVATRRLMTNLRQRELARV